MKYEKPEINEKDYEEVVGEGGGTGGAFIAGAAVVGVIIIVLG